MLSLEGIVSVWTSSLLLQDYHFLFPLPIPQILFQLENLNPFPHNKKFEVKIYYSGNNDKRTHFSVLGYHFNLTMSYYHSFQANFVQLIGPFIIRFRGTLYERAASKIIRFRRTWYNWAVYHSFQANLVRKKCVVIKAFAENRNPNCVFQDKSGRLLPRRR